MKPLTLGLALALTFAFSLPNTLLARAPGGQHGGGHSGGGHSGGSHAGGGHSSGGHSSGGHAGGTHSSGGSHSAAATSRSGGSHSGSLTGRVGARPRDGRPIVGTAVPRITTIQPIVVTSFGFLPSRRWPYSSAVGFGALGFYDDPLWSGYSYGGYATDPQDPFDAAGPTGALRLKVKPNDAEVYVDGYFAGIVDNFDGHFQHLTLTAGPHRVEVRAPGYQPLTFDVAIQPRHTTEYRGALQR